VPHWWKNKKTSGAPAILVGIIHIAIGNLQCEQFYYNRLLAYRQFCFLSNFVDSCRKEKESEKQKKPV